MGPPVVPECRYGVHGEGWGWGGSVGGLTLDLGRRFQLLVSAHNLFGWLLLLLLLIPLLLLQMVIGELGSCKKTS